MYLRIIIILKDLFLSDWNSDFRSRCTLKSVDFWWEPMGTNETQMVLALALLDSEEIRCRHLFVTVPSLIVSVVIDHSRVLLCGQYLAHLARRPSFCSSLQPCLMLRKTTITSPGISWKFAAMAACTIWVSLYTIIYMGLSENRVYSQ